MADYKTYLATNILTEDKTVDYSYILRTQKICLTAIKVSYRLLSRALKVHVNTAKEYDNSTKLWNIRGAYTRIGCYMTFTDPKMQRNPIPSTQRTC